MYWLTQLTAWFVPGAAGQDPPSSPIIEAIKGIEMRVDRTGAWHDRARRTRLYRSTRISRFWIDPVPDHCIGDNVA
ncbi:hypothetical protein LTR66_002867 [Elasticomyces elasticus]|nr:hypothetical protein LTR66_002867 [Elasticomyces elasticus]